MITTPNTFVATTNMLLAIGARPVFADIRLDTYNLDETKIEKLITTRTRAMVPVHFAGQPCALKEITKIAKKHKLLVIEDACHALGASYRKRPIGGISDMTVFSFHPIKSITTGEGGAILTNKENFYKRLVSLRSHGVEKDNHGFNVMFKLGFNYRMTDIQAALGTSQLSKLDRFVKSRKRIAKQYHQNLKNLKEVVLPIEDRQSLSSWHIYVIRTKSAADRKPLAEHLKSLGINTNFHYPAVYTHPFYQKKGYVGTNLTNTDNHHKTCLTLPCYYNLSSKNVDFICRSIKNFFDPIRSLARVARSKGPLGRVTSNNGVVKKHEDTK